MKLYPEHIAKEPTLEVCEELDQHGYPVDVLETRIASSESSDKCYIVQRIQTTTVPFERADVAADETELVVCSCPSGMFHSFENVKLDTSLSGYSACKHAGVFREQRAKQDDQQGTLI